MNVFISWSGQYSQKIAACFRDWLPAVLQYVRPFFTPNDIEKGARWSSEIASKLDESACGIFIVTPENRESTWMLFEAGAISKRVDYSLVCPIVFAMRPADVVGPFSQFQISVFSKNDIYKLLKTINSTQPENRLEDAVLNTVFEMWWPKLEKEIQSIPLNDVAKTPRSQEDILNEILVLNRTIVSSLGTHGQDNDFVSLVSRFVSMFDLVFGSGDWDHTKSCLVESDYYIQPNSTFIDPGVEDESNNWSNRGSLLHAYRDLVEYAKRNGIALLQEF